jgi:hypothetical protein
MVILMDEIGYQMSHSQPERRRSSKKESTDTEDSLEADHELE